MRKKSTIYLNVAICLLFIGLSCWLFSIESTKVITEGFPLNQTIGVLGVIVNTALLVKWIYIWATQPKS